jgi:ABC-type glycerol-3-phosphate transport system substrate-binding protein
MAWLSDLKASGVLLVNGDNDFNQVLQAMQKGQVAFWTTRTGQTDYSWFYGKAPSFKVGVAPMPAMESFDTTASIPDVGHFISASSDNVPACWNWIKFLSEQPTVFAGVPARRSVMELPEWETWVGSENAAAYRAALDRVYRPDYTEELPYDPVPEPYYTWKYRILSAALQGEDYQKLASEIQQMADDYLVCMAPVDRGNLTEDEYSAEVNRCAQQVDPDGGWDKD